MTLDPSGLEHATHHDIRPMVEADLPRVVPAQARAFEHDPLQVWALPDSATRVARIERVFHLQLAIVSVPLGACFTDPTGAVGAFWAPPGRWDPPPEVMARLVPLGAVVGEDGMRRLRLASEAMKAAHPREPHWYLAGLGTDPPRQGAGLASAALAPVLERCDTEGLPAYLESTRAANVAFYERHGFRATGEVVIGDDGPRLVAMWRDPA